MVDPGGEKWAAFGEAALESVAESLAPMRRIAAQVSEAIQMSSTPALRAAAEVTKAAVWSESMTTNVARIAAQFSAFNEQNSALAVSLSMMGPTLQAALRQPVITPQYSAALESMARFSRELSERAVSSTTAAALLELADEHVEAATEVAPSDPLGMVRLIAAGCVCLALGGLAAANRDPVANEELRAQLQVLVEMLLLYLAVGPKGSDP